MYSIKDSIDTRLVSKLLGDFNWRPRRVGAYFAAIASLNEHEENIGNLLLRSEVCYAGHNYCLALASFESLEAIDYLERYLTYYLEQPDLYFDQNSAMSALSYIGNLKDKDLISPYMDSWHEFTADKPDWNLDASIDNFNEQMQTLNEFKCEIGY